MYKRRIEFAEAKKATKKLLRPARLSNVATKQVAQSMGIGAGRKGLLWLQEGRSEDYIKQKMEAFGEKLKAKKKQIAEKNKLYLDNKKIDKTVDEFNKALKAPPNIINSPPKSLVQALADEGIDVSKLERAPKKSIEQVIKPVGSGKGLLIGAGIAGAAALGGLGYGLYRKSRSDKGKKRGKYKNFNSSSNYAEFSYRKKIKDPDKFFKKIGKKNKTIKDPNKFFQMLGKKYT